MISIKRSIQTTLQNGSLKRYYASAIPNLVQSVDDFKVKNEPVLGYKKGSQERKLLEDAIAKYSSSTVEIPLVVDSERFSTNLVQHQVAPFDHQLKLAKYYWATPEILAKAIKVSQERKHDWERVPLNEKIKLFLKAADLVSGKYRYDLNAATMLGQSKTIIQAEIDAAAELADFLRFNAFFAKELLNYQPISEKPNEVLNLFRYRSLDGFVAAISPFNFTAIGGNLATAPTLMGNTVLWKPSDTALLSNYIIYQLLEEAGFPKGVINFLPCDGPVFGNVITKSRKLAGINFTGSVATFNHIWREVANNLELYDNYPRLVGECGGKNFHFVHNSANLDTVVTCTIRSAFEYSGQKCSACSRAYIPQSIWAKVKSRLIEETKSLKLGSALDPKSFLSAVIDEKAFKRIASYIDHARQCPNLEILAGGNYDQSKGYFIEPTIVLTTDPNDKIIREEIFGPLLTVYVYEDSKLEETLNLVRTSRYGLTGAIFGEDQKFLEHAAEFLKHEAGNFYVNDKSTGSVVGQQPFGGSKMSGTNDKAGGPHYLLRWASPQNVKQTFVPQTQITYPYMQG